MRLDVGHRVDTGVETSIGVAAETISSLIDLVPGVAALGSIGPNIVKGSGTTTRTCNKNSATTIFGTEIKRGRIFVAVVVTRCLNRAAIGQGKVAGKLVPAAAIGQDRAPRAAIGQDRAPRAAIGQDKAPRAAIAGRLASQVLVIGPAAATVLQGETMQ